MNGHEFGPMRFAIENLKEITGATIAVNGTFYPFTTTSNACNKIMIQNLTNQIMYFSDDGVNDKMVVPIGGFILLDIRAAGDYLRKDTIFYARKKTAVVATGSVFLTCFFEE